MNGACVSDVRSRLVELEGRVVDFLVDLAVGDLSVPELTFAQLHDGKWADFDLSGYSGRLDVDGARLRLLVDAPSEASFWALQEAMKIRNQASALTLADGSTVVAELAHMPHLGSQAELSLHHWVWRTRQLPLYWLGVLDGRLSQLGNLSVVAKHGRETRCRDGFRLEGRYTWHLFPNDQERSPLVLLDARGAQPERDELVKDLLCMEFAFGTPLRLDRLVGVDAAMNPVGAMSVGHLVRQGNKRRSPVPDFLVENGIWIPQLFRLLSMKIHSEGSLPLMVGIAPYLDAESDHLDGAYLKVQVGLEAFANRLVGRGTPNVLVANPADWKKWVKSLKTTIQQHVVDPKKVETIYGKFVSAMYAPSGDRVERALKAHGIVVPVEVIEEVAKRNYPAHGFLMNEDLEHDVDRDHRRLEIVQTLMAALVACHVGYGGPLRGYDVDEDGHRPSPQWWPVTWNREDVFIRYVATTASPGHEHVS